MTANDKPVFISGIWTQPLTWKPVACCSGCPNTGGCPQGCQRERVGRIEFAPPARQGWICPRCNAVKSPDVQECGCRVVGGEIVT
jgi:hypothetical protein